MAININEDYDKRPGVSPKIAKSNGLMVNIDSSDGTYTSNTLNVLDYFTIDFLVYISSSANVIIEASVDEEIWIPIGDTLTESGAYGISYPNTFEYIRVRVTENNDNVKVWFTAAGWSNT